tara:strand:- start:73 stop:255 length:183 start_codon:yes stop_codon:yes gene_type:complete
VKNTLNLPNFIPISLNPQKPQKTLKKQPKRFNSPASRLLFAAYPHRFSKKWGLFLISLRR